MVFENNYNHECKGGVSRPYVSYFNRARLRP
jgi:hypothetical protein